jgi:hypothetical protein
LEGGALVLQSSALAAALAVPRLAPPTVQSNQGIQLVSEQKERLKGWEAQKAQVIWPLAGLVTLRHPPVELPAGEKKGSKP